MKNIQTELTLATQQTEQNTNATNGTTRSDATKNLLTHHLSSFLDNDLEAVVSDYTDESVLITQAATYIGRKEIATFFADLIIHFPKGNANFDLDKMEVKDEFAFIVWHATTPSVNVPLGSDTFIITGGKIRKQTFVGIMEFIIAS